MAKKRASKKQNAVANAQASLEKPSDEKVLSSFSSTAEIKVSPKMVDQIIGQEKAVEIVKKASSQKRNVLLVGLPGTGKSMLAQAMAELIPVSELQDILITVNPLDENVPKVKVVKAGDGRKIVEAEKMKSRVAGGNVNFLLILFMVFSSAMILFYMRSYFGDVISAALLISLYVMGGAMMFASQISRGRLVEMDGVKMLVDNHGKKKAPFIEATGAKAGSLLGDCRHDPFQCIPGDQLVHLSNGKPVEMSTLVDPLMTGEGDRELSESEKFSVLGGSDADFCYSPTTVRRVFKRNYSGKLVKITTRRGQKITVTPNHPIAFLNSDGRIEYVEAGLFDPEKHFCILPRVLPTYAGAPLSKNFVLLLADILADGYIGERGVQFKLKREFKIRQITADIRAAGYSPRVLTRNGITFVYINNTAFAKQLASLGAKTPSGKQIPAALFSQSPDVIRSFVFRYLSLDGYVGKQGQFELQSKEMIPDFVPLLLRIGVVPKRRDRPDRGFKKGNLQPRIIFGDRDFAQAYLDETINPFHKANLQNYLASTRFKHVSFADLVPLSFEFLEKIREKSGLSKTKVHDSYYAVNPQVSTYTPPTRSLLEAICSSFLSVTNGPDLFRLRNVVQGTYAFDEIEKKELVDYDGYVYNLTTETGNYLVNCVLTHNSGGLGTPAHLRVEAGFIHKANKGVLFIDEVSALRPKSQQELLTAMQEKKYSITGQSEMSSGAMVRTEPVPCDFVLVAAGNYVDVQKMHPALRSRIRGYGYEVYMQEHIDDNEENLRKIVQFVAQEVTKDGKIPHFDRSAVKEIFKEARKRAGRKNKLTLKLRELGGIVRAAGDVAHEKGAPLVSFGHVMAAKKIARTLEQQATQQFIDVRKDYNVFLTQGAAVGRVNGLAVIGDAGLVMPIVAEVAPASSKFEGKTIATGKLGTIAAEAVQNVSAIVKKHLGKDTSNYDIHVQFLQSYEGVEGDSASVSVATAVISALEGLPIDQSVAMTGSLSVRGQVLPIGGATQKAEAAAEAGIKKLLLPAANVGDLVLEESTRKNLEIIPVKDVFDVLEHSLAPGAKKQKMLALLRKQLA